MTSILSGCGRSGLNGAPGRGGPVPPILAALLLSAQLLLVSCFNISVHPTCNHLPRIVPRVQDITALLHGSLPERTCVYNPSVTRLGGDIFVWSASAYTPHDEEHSCVASYETQLRMVASDRWRGKKEFVLAVTRGSFEGRGAMSFDLLGHRTVRMRMTDGRLFRDAAGDPWVLSHTKLGDGGFLAVTPIQITNCGAALAPERHSQADGTDGSERGACVIGLGGSRVLWYEQAQQMEKNWVPHSGTHRTSYPHYGTFGPHSVLDWGSYHDPAHKSGFDAQAPEAFFERFSAKHRHEFAFSGGTPAVPYHDGASYIAVGHIHARAACFHHPDGHGGGNVSARCSLKAVAAERGRLRNREYRHGGCTYEHHKYDYAMFAYRFDARPPYAITHLSHGFLPCTHHHSGVVFPAGLEVLGPGQGRAQQGQQGDPGPADYTYLISYGEADRYSRLLQLSGSDMEALLRPMGQLREAVWGYSVCTLPCG